MAATVFKQPGDRIGTWPLAQRCRALPPLMQRLVALASAVVSLTDACGHLYRHDDPG
jgi:hypothetical protein